MTDNVQIMTEKPYCGQCEHFYNFYCSLRNIQVSYSGKTCPQFNKRWYND